MWKIKSVADEFPEQVGTDSCTIWNENLFKVGYEKSPKLDKEETRNVLYFCRKRIICTQAWCCSNYSASNCISYIFCGGTKWTLATGSK